jgi:hypothetical protein
VEVTSIGVPDEVAAVAGIGLEADEGVAGGVTLVIYFIVIGREVPIIFPDQMDTTT